MNILKVLKGIGKGVLNVATGGLLDAVKEHKVVKQVVEETKSSGSSITKGSQFYQILDLADDGELNNSFSQKKAELIGKGIGGLATIIILVWQYVQNM